MALSLVATAADRTTLTKTQDLLRAEVNSDDPLKPYAFKIDAIDGLRCVLVTARPFCIHAQTSVFTA